MKSALPETPALPPGPWQNWSQPWLKSTTSKLSQREELLRAAYQDLGANKSKLEEAALRLSDNPEEFVADWIERARQSQKTDRVPPIAFLQLLIEAIEARKAKNPKPNARTKSPDWRARYLDGIFAALEKRKASKGSKNDFREFMDWLIRKHALPDKLPTITKEYLHPRGSTKRLLREALKFAKSGKAEPLQAVLKLMLQLVGDKQLVICFDEGAEWKRVALLALRTAFRDRHEAHIAAMESWLFPTRELRTCLVALGDKGFVELFDRTVGVSWLIPSVGDALDEKRKKQNAARRRPDAKSRKKSKRRAKPISK